MPISAITIVLVRYSEGDVVIGETSETLQQNEEDHPLLDDHDQSDSETTEIVCKLK